MRSLSSLLFVSLLSLTSCGDDDADRSGASEPSTPEPATPEPTTPEPTPTPAVPDLPAEPPPAAPSGMILPATLMTADVGGMVFHEAAFIRHGDGAPALLQIRSNACADGVCTFVSDRCRGTTRTAHSEMPGGFSSSTTVTAEPLDPADAALCARFAGTFSMGHPSDPRAGGPPPPPTFEGSDCLLRSQVVSVDRGVCASFDRNPIVDGTPETYAVTTYRGACCLGTELARMTTPVDIGTAFVGADGLSIVVARHEPAIAREEIAADPVLFLVVRPTASTELRLNQLFAGDPILTEGSGFAFRARVSEGAVFVTPIGGTEHRFAF